MNKVREYWVINVKMCYPTLSNIALTNGPEIEKAEISK